MSEHRILYFAYGSNMDTKQMECRCGPVEVVGPATLAGFRLCFPRRSQKLGCGVASIERADGECVEGVVYALTPEQLDKLDKREGVHIGPYTRGTVTVVVERTGEATEAVTYFAVPQSGGPFLPDSSYMAKLIRGAQNNGLSSDYIERLRQIETEG